MQTTGKNSMKILCLYNNDCALESFRWLRQHNNQCMLWSKELSVEWIREQHFDFSVNYTYSRIIKPDVIKELKNKIVNLHTFLLLWNRGG